MAQSIAEMPRPESELPPTAQVDVLAPNHLERFNESLNANGYAVFDGIMSPEHFLGLAEEMGVPRRYIQTDENGITTLSSREEVKGVERPGKFDVDHELLQHTDGSAMQEPAQLLMLYCVQSDTAGGGESMIADGKRVYEKLEQQHPDLLKRLEAPESVIFGPKEVADKQLKTSIIAVETDGLVNIRLRRDEESWYVDPNGELRPISELNGELKPFYDLIDEETVRFTLRPGQGFVINNRRMLHGRTKVLGEREVKRIQMDIPQDPWLNFPLRSLPKGFYP